MSKHWIPLPSEDEAVGEVSKKPKPITNKELGYDADDPNLSSKLPSDHTVGSHSDDRGGDADFPCYCEAKAVWASRNPAAERTNSLARASSDSISKILSELFRKGTTLAHAENTSVAAAQQEIEAYAKSEVIKELEALTEEAEFAQHMMDDGFDHEAVRTTHIEDRISGLKGKK